jgi:hypothetical protein
MSGVVRGVKKVFSAVGHAVKKLWQNKIVRAIIIAAAIYFTAGAAAGYFGAAGTAAEVGTTAVATGAGEGAAATAMEAAVVDESAGLAMTSAAETGAGAAAGAGEAAAGAAIDESAGLAMGNAGADAAGAAGSTAGGAAGNAAGSAVIDESAGLSMTPQTAAGGMAQQSATQGLINDAVAQGSDAAAQGATQGAMDESAGLSMETPSYGVDTTQINPISAGQAPTINPMTPNPNGGLINGALDWYKGLDPATKTLMGQGVSGAAKGAFEMYGNSQKLALQQQAARRHDPSRPSARHQQLLLSPEQAGLVNSNRG